MENEKTMDELFDELKKELVFLPDIDLVREAFINGFVMQLMA